MNEIRTTITYNLPILRKYMIFVRIYNLFGFHKDGRTNRCGNEAYLNSKSGEDVNSASSPDFVEITPPK